MSKKEKLKKRFVSKPKDFSFDELSTLLTMLGYQISNKGKTSGSRVQFINTTTDHIIICHKPHPSNIVKCYVISQILDELKKENLL